MCNWENAFNCQVSHGKMQIIDRDSRQRPSPIAQIQDPNSGIRMRIRIRIQIRIWWLSCVYLLIFFARSSAIQKQRQHFSKKVETFLLYRKTFRWFSQWKNDWVHEEKKKCRKGVNFVHEISRCGKLWSVFTGTLHRKAIQVDNRNDGGQVAAPKR